jgi:hypothetical protein
MLTLLVVVPPWYLQASKRMVGILSLGDVSHSAPAELLLECIKNVSAPSLRAA